MSSDYVIDEGFFRTNCGFVKARLEYDKGPIDPWEEFDHLGSLVINTNCCSGYNLGDEKTGSWSEYFYNDTPDLTGEDYERMSEKELYEKWKESKMAVIPVSFFDYGSNGCRLSFGDNDEDLEINHYGNGGWIDNAGFMYVEKYDKEVVDYKYTKDECIRYMKAALQEYSDYIEGNVYCCFWETWNEEKLEWGPEDCCGAIFLSQDTPYGDQLKEALQDVYAKVYEEVYEGQINLLKMTITHKYYDYIKDELCYRVNNSLDMFDGNYKYALKHVLSIWCKDLDYNRDSVIVDIFHDCITDFDKRADIMKQLVYEWRKGIKKEA